MLELSYVIYRAYSHHSTLLLASINECFPSYSIVCNWIKPACLSHLGIVTEKIHAAQSRTHLCFDLLVGGSWMNTTRILINHLHTLRQLSSILNQTELGLRRHRMFASNDFTKVAEMLNDYGQSSHAYQSVKMTYSLLWLEITRAGCTVTC